MSLPSGGDTLQFSGISVNFHTALRTHEVDICGTETCEKKGVDRPLAEGPVLNDPRRKDWAEAETSDEEVELQNRRRPKRGEGWWGAGPPVQIHRKGEPRPLTDGAGLPSPGRWPIARRRLPQREPVKQIRQILLEGLQA